MSQNKGIKRPFPQEKCTGLRSGGHMDSIPPPTKRLKGSSAQGSSTGSLSHSRKPIQSRRASRKNTNAARCASPSVRPTNLHNISSPISKKKNVNSHLKNVNEKPLNDNKKNKSKNLINEDLSRIPKKSQINSPSKAIKMDNSSPITSSPANVSITTPPKSYHNVCNKPHIAALSEIFTPSKKPDEEHMDYNNVPIIFNESSTLKSEDNNHNKNKKQHVEAHRRNILIPLSQMENADNNFVLSNFLHKMVNPHKFVDGSNMRPVYMSSADGKPKSVLINFGVSKFIGKDDEKRVENVQAMDSIYTIKAEPATRSMEDWFVKLATEGAKFVIINKPVLTLAPAKSLTTVDESGPLILHVWGAKAMPTIPSPDICNPTNRRRLIYGVEEEGIGERATHPPYGMMVATSRNRLKDYQKTFAAHLYNKPQINKNPIQLTHTFANLLKEAMRKPNPKHYFSSQPINLFLPTANEKIWSVGPPMSQLSAISVADHDGYLLGHLSTKVKNKIEEHGTNTDLLLNGVKLHISSMHHRPWVAIKDIEAIQNATAIPHSMYLPMNDSPEYGKLFSTKIPAYLWAGNAETFKCLSNPTGSVKKKKAVLSSFIKKDLSFNKPGIKPHYVNHGVSIDFAVATGGARVQYYRDKDGNEQSISLYQGHDGEYSCDVQIHGSLMEDINEAFASAGENDIHLINIKYIWINHFPRRILRILEMDSAVVADVTMNTKDIYFFKESISTYHASTPPVEVTNDLQEMQRAIARINKNDLTLTPKDKSPSIDEESDSNMQYIASKKSNDSDIPPPENSKILKKHRNRIIPMDIDNDDDLHIPQFYNSSDERTIAIKDIMGSNISKTEFAHLYYLSDKELIYALSKKHKPAPINLISPSSTRYSPFKKSNSSVKSQQQKPSIPMNSPLAPSSSRVNNERYYNDNNHNRRKPSGTRHARKFIQELSENRSIDISKINSINKPCSNPKIVRKLFYDFSNDTPPSDEVEQSEYYKAKFYPMSDIGKQLFPIHKKTTRIIRHPFKVGVYATFTLIELAVHAKVNTISRRQRIIEEMEFWADLRSEQFGADGDMCWERPSIRPTSQWKKNFRYRNHIPSNVYRCVSSSLNQDQKILLMKNFETDRFTHKRVTQGLILLSDQIGLTEENYLDTAVSCIVYPEATPNKNWMIIPHKIGVCYREERSIIVMQAFNGPEDLEFIWWMDDVRDRNADTIFSVKTLGAGYILIIAGTGVDEIGWQKSLPVNRINNKSFSYSFFTKSKSYQEQKEKIDIRLAQKSTLRVKKENKQYRKDTAHLEPYKKAVYATCNNVIQSDLMKTEYHQVQHPINYHKLNKPLRSNDANNNNDKTENDEWIDYNLPQKRRRGPINRSMYTFVYIYFNHVYDLIKSISYYSQLQLKYQLVFTYYNMLYVLKVITLSINIQYILNSTFVDLFINRSWIICKQKVIRYGLKKSWIY